MYIHAMADLTSNNYNAFTRNHILSIRNVAKLDRSTMANSVADPDFTSATNLTPQSADVNNIGAALGVTTDYLWCSSKYNYS